MRRKNRRIVVGRRLRRAGQPREEVAVGRFHQVLEDGQLFVVQPVDLGIGETAEHEIHLARAAMPAAEQRLAPTRIEVGGGSCRTRHRDQPGLAMPQRPDARRTLPFTTDIGFEPSSVSLCRRRTDDKHRPCALPNSIPSLRLGLHRSGCRPQAFQASRRLGLAARRAGWCEGARPSVPPAERRHRPRRREAIRDAPEAHW